MKKTFRLFHTSRRVSSFTLGSLLVAIPMIILSVIAAIVLLPLALLAFILELPQAIVAGVENSGKFTAGLSSRLTRAWDALFDRDKQLVDRKKRFEEFGIRPNDGNFYEHKVEHKGGVTHETFTVHLGGQETKTKPVLPSRN